MLGVYAPAGSARWTGRVRSRELVVYLFFIGYLYILIAMSTPFRGFRSKCPMELAGTRCKLGTYVV